MDSCNSLAADYPAAHSMDSEWFAVDADGFVAKFSTGEAGAMPIEAIADEEGEIADQVAQLEWDSASILDWQSFEIPFSPAPLHVEETVRRTSKIKRPSLWQRIIGANPRTSAEEDYLPVIMLAMSLEPFAADTRSGKAKIIETTRGSAIYYEKIPQDRFQELHTYGVCAGCHVYFDYSTEEGARNPGIFLFNHDATENWISGPYGRSAIPAHPVTIADLSPQLRATIEKVTFSAIRFSDIHWIQPVEWVRCESIEPAYLTSDWKEIRAIPGKEIEFAENLEQYRADSDDDCIVIVPPSG